MKMIKTITVITSIQSVWVTRPSRSDLGAIRARLGQVCGAWPKFCGFKASMRQYKYELIEPHFVLRISRPPSIVQKWFCIQNVRMDLSFQEKKMI